MKLFQSAFLQGEILTPTYNTSVAAGFTEQMNSTVHACYLRVVFIDYLHPSIKLKMVVYSVNICLRIIIITTITTIIIITVIVNNNNICNYDNNSNNHNSYNNNNNIITIIITIIIKLLLL